MRKKELNFDALYGEVEEIKGKRRKTPEIFDANATCEDRRKILKNEKKMREDTIIALYDRVKKTGDPNTAKMLAAYMKWDVVERKEEKIIHEVSPDELTIRYLEADRRLREQGFRVADVQEESALLHDPLRLDSGQVSAEGSEVAAVASPDGDTKRLSEPTL